MELHLRFPIRLQATRPYFVKNMNLEAPHFAIYSSFLSSYVISRIHIAPCSGTSCVSSVHTPGDQLDY